ncbi:peptidoglycan-binding domain-containing protein [Streptomyces roseoviridis]|uniref:peptidoglycan-binding domain-containing protein n=1 Tax=Streptomyces roseoviridis TaxID=67361 RepID=UPI0031F12A8D
MLNPASANAASHTGPLPIRIRATFTTVLVFTAALIGGLIPGAASAAAAAPASPAQVAMGRCGLYNGSDLISRGDRGTKVKEAQCHLHAWRYLPESTDVDGEFGPKTERAVMAFQRDRRLAVDGIVGPRTWAALRNG